jgi:hypothetical protein
VASFDYAVIRVVPRVEREESLNVGVIVFCKALDFLAARVELDEPRLRAFYPLRDDELAALRASLRAMERVAAGDPAAGPIAALPQADRFHWLTAPKSAIVQVSPVHSGICDDPARTVEHLLERVVRVPR